MGNPNDELIQRAIAAARSGNKIEAKKLLANALQNDNQDARIWYLLSQLIDRQDQKIQCLEKALELQPENSQIQEKLAQLKKPLPDLNLPERPKKKTAWWVYALLGISVPVLLCLCVGMIFGSSDSPGGLSNPFKSTHKVVYRVEGTASTALISYTNDQLGTEQINDAHIPWEKIYEMDNGAGASLVAQSGDRGKSIICIIELDGKEWKRSSSSGDYVMVTCSGWIGLE